MKTSRITFSHVSDIQFPPLPPPLPLPPEPLASGRWVDVSRDGSTIAIGQSTPSFTGGFIHMHRGVDFLTGITLTSTLGAVNEYGNGIATNADGSVVVCGCLHTGGVYNGFAAVRYGVDWANEIWLEPAGSSGFLCYAASKPVAISDDGSIIVLKDDYKIYVCSGIDWGDILELTPSGGDSVYCVAISGDGTVIAAGNAEDAVHVFYGTDYGTETVITPSGGVDSLDSFGWNVALNSDGTILAVGNHSNGGSEQGAGYLFTGTSWSTEQKFFVISGPYSSPSEHFGWSVDISADGSVAAFGAWGRPPTGIVFRESGVGYSVETQILRPSGGGLGTFGVDIALSEDGAIMAVTEDDVWVIT